MASPEKSHPPASGPPRRGSGALHLAAELEHAAAVVLLDDVGGVVVGAVPGDLGPAQGPGHPGPVDLDDRAGRAAPAPLPADGRALTDAHACAVPTKPASDPGK